MVYLFVIFTIQSVTTVINQKAVDMIHFKPQKTEESGSLSSQSGKTYC